MHKFLAQCGVASRRAAEDLIQAGRVSVNGRTVRELGVSISPRDDAIAVDGKPVARVEPGIMLLHKPKNVVSTLQDPQQRPALNHYLTKQTKSYFPVGRLDFESTGLVILTNDGELAQHLLHPRYSIARVYELEVEGFVSDDLIRAISKGIKLEDGPARADVSLARRTEQSSSLQVSIMEGRNRILRRLFAQVGHPVLDLKRIAHGPFRLGTLKPGQVRRLNSSEYTRMRRLVLKGHQRASAHALTRSARRR